MDKTIILTLPLSQVIEMVATLSVFLDMRESGNDFLREAEKSIRDQTLAQSTIDEFREAEHCIAVQTLIGRTV